MLARSFDHAFHPNPDLWLRSSLRTFILRRQMFLWTVVSILHKKAGQYTIQLFHWRLIEISSRVLNKDLRFQAARNLLV
jgi:hypothetical protein